VSESLVRNLWLVPLLPLLGALATILLSALLGRVWSRFVALPVVLGIGGAAVISALTLAGFRAEGEEPLGRSVLAFEWIRAGDFVVPIEFRADALSLAMITMVTGVATLIAIFAAGYMSDDSAKPRFFGMVGLFVFCMTGLVLSNNFALTYAFWEGVGVCSYLLIGHYHAKPSAAEAAQKAFLVNRIGDVGFALAIFWMWTTFGSLSYDVVLADSSIAQLAPGALAGISLLLFWAATAKSAQVPLYTWLPDAMEGPTPVSALIHAATMVTAGVYLVARSYILFQAAPPFVLATVAAIGCITAVLAAGIALTQTDLKRVLAYSTVSQLGFMFMALGAGVGDVAQFAVVAAMFHLITHAFFKALLFLGSGSVMHAMGGVIDMRRFGGLAKKMPVTCITFAIGSLALAGFPLTSGFFSKDEILVALDEASHAAGSNGWIYAAIYWIALFTALLTAYYITRAFCMTFLGPEKLPSPSDPEADPEEGHGHGHGHDHGHGHGHHELGHESPAIMTVPLIILAVLAASAGLAMGATHAFPSYLETAPGIHSLAPAPEPFHGRTTMALGTAASLLGIGLGLALHRGGSDLKVPARGPLRAFLGASQGKFFVDEAYAKGVVAPLRILSKLAYIFDVILVEPLTRAVALLPGLLARIAFAPAQNGVVQYYAIYSALGVAALFVLFLFFNV
jgi:proton-translocating NADH-quinone oxidoreductase chain L